MPHSAMHATAQIGEAVQLAFLLRVEEWPWACAAPNPFAVLAIPTPLAAESAVVVAGLVARAASSFAGVSVCTRLAALAFVRRRIGSAWARRQVPRIWAHPRVHVALTRANGAGFGQATTRILAARVAGVSNCEPLLTARPVGAPWSFACVCKPAIVAHALPVLCAETVFAAVDSAAGDVDVFRRTAVVTFEVFLAVAFACQNIADPVTIAGLSCARQRVADKITVCAANEGCVAASVACIAGDGASISDGLAAVTARGVRGTRRRSA